MGAINRTKGRRRRLNEVTEKNKEVANEVEVAVAAAEMVSTQVSKQAEAGAEAEAEAEADLQTHHVLLMMAVLCMVLTICLPADKR